MNDVDKMRYLRDEVAKARVLAGCPDKCVTDVLGTDDGFVIMHIMGRGKAKLSDSMQFPGDLVDQKTAEVIARDLLAPRHAP